MTAALTTDAWVIHRGEGRNSGPAQLSRENFTLPALGDGDVLVEPLYGCWEGNMAHALDRRPVDICAQRDEASAVVGNSSVVRAVEVGAGVSGIDIGQTYMCIGIGIPDEFGYMMLAHAYDAPGTVGALAKRAPVPARNLYPIPSGSSASLAQWAAFSLRYMTAWSNWHVAYNCFRTQLSATEMAHPHVWGWGGGSTLAELELAKNFGCQTAMVSGNDDNLATIRASGIEAIDRREFPDLAYDADRYAEDREYRASYKDSEKRFLALVDERTEGRGVQIFVDYIGLPTVRVTQKAVGRLGVITSAGWKHGMDTQTNRAMECISRHIHVHTHYARFEEVAPAMAFSEKKGWMPHIDPDDIYDYDDIPRLAADYAAGRTGYFPIYRINDET